MEKPWQKFYDMGVPHSLVYPKLPVFEYLTRSAQRFPDQPCTIFRDQVITYAEMDRLSDVFAAGLASIGVKKGDRIGVLLPNLPQFVLVFYGILKAGGIVVAMNPQYKKRELLYQIQDSDVRVLISLNDQMEMIQEIRKQASLSSVILTNPDDAFDMVDSVLNTGLNLSNILPDSEDYWLLTFLAQSKDLKVDRNLITANDPAIFQYSGGTTGTPKAAIGTHYNLVANTLQFRSWLIGLEDGKEVVLAAIPLFHVYGMVIAMGVGVVLGASMVIIQNPRNIDDILHNIQKYKATLFPGVPNLYQAINQNPGVLAGEINLRSIKACISGSAPLLLETKTTFERLTGGKLMEGYGLSEAPTATHCNPMFGENRSGSIGLPLPDVECKIVDLETGKQILPAGEIGELIIKGPQVMQGYHHRDDETKITLVDGWLYTGDIAKMDTDGFFYIVDRKKELIKIGGFQVWPREIEEVIAMHPAVKEVAAAGVPHPEKVEIVKTWVVTKPNHFLTEEEVRIWCGQHLARYKVPSEVEFRTELPRTYVGKLLRRELIREHIEKK